ncbi:MAG: 2-haloalkanoic acid dehalogenase, type [Actinomycetia bacterium]|nr:2-haloalkanoic acid dehalogenase, type [Actinomycetes bacterium]
MSIEALVFDVFGTVVDWRSSVIAAAVDAGLVGDPGAFADEWRRDGYLRPIVAAVRGEAQWRPVDELMRTHLDELAPRYGLDGADLDALSGVWRRLDPWPDAVAGLARLKERFTIAPLSNGGFAQLTAMARHAGLPWDCIISTDLFRSYKPDPACYRGAVELLDLPADRVLLVAAHPADLRAAQACGLRAAYVPRPREWGPDAAAPEAPDPAFDFVATDFRELAQLIAA